MKYLDNFTWNPSLVISKKFEKKIRPFRKKELIMIRSQSRLPDVETHFYDQNPLFNSFLSNFSAKAGIFFVCP